jgi:hypothetical protein
MRFLICLIVVLISTSALAAKQACPRPWKLDCIILHLDSQQYTKLVEGLGASGDAERALLFASRMDKHASMLALWRSASAATLAGEANAALLLLDAVTAKNQRGPASNSVVNKASDIGATELAVKASLMAPATYSDRSSNLTVAARLLEADGQFTEAENLVSEIETRWRREIWALSFEKLIDNGDISGAASYIAKAEPKFLEPLNAAHGIAMYRYFVAIGEIEEAKSVFRTLLKGAKEAPAPVMQARFLSEIYFKHHQGGELRVALKLANIVLAQSLEYVPRIKSQFFDLFAIHAAGLGELDQARSWLEEVSLPDVRQDVLEHIAINTIIAKDFSGALEDASSLKDNAVKGRVLSKLYLTAPAKSAEAKAALSLLIEEKRWNDITSVIFALAERNDISQAILLGKLAKDTQFGDKVMMKLAQSLARNGFGAEARIAMKNLDPPLIPLIETLARLEAQGQ